MGGGGQWDETQCFRRVCEARKAMLTEEKDCHMCTVAKRSSGKVKKNVEGKEGNLNH